MYERYWNVAYDLVRVWGQYNGVKKLYYNATHSETRHRVWHVVAKHYGGSVNRVKEREYDLDCQVDACLCGFDSTCMDFGINSVSRDWLYDNLKCSADYASLRGKIERRRNKDAKPVSLKTLMGS